MSTTLTPSSTAPITVLLVLLMVVISYAAAAPPENGPKDLVRSSCSHARYPNVCLRTLSSYQGPANTPRDLAQAAVQVSIARARGVSTYLTALRGGLVKAKRERIALNDCVEQISDSVDELGRALGELKHLRTGGEAFRWQMSNAQTWVSAALTNDETCLNGFDEVGGRARSELRGRITNVAMVTSNALYMINRLGESRGRPKLGGR